MAMYLRDACIALESFATSALPPSPSKRTTLTPSELASPDAAAGVPVETVACWPPLVNRKIINSSASTAKSGSARSHHRISVSCSGSTFSSFPAFSSNCGVASTSGARPWWGNGCPHRAHFSSSPSVCTPQNEHVLRTDRETEGSDAPASSNCSDGVVGAERELEFGWAGSGSNASGSGKIKLQKRHFRASARTSSAQSGHFLVAGLEGVVSWPEPSVDAFMGASVFGSFSRTPDDEEARSAWHLGHRVASGWTRSRQWGHLRSVPEAKAKARPNGPSNTPKPNQRQPLAPRLCATRAAPQDQLPEWPTRFWAAPGRHSGKTSHSTIG